ncbi:MAG TPA: two-component regulator propeller domain-containing protein, partial [Flavobacteriales bacterium]|nr:two-component regulator propeller domain-containing protein [Flavobacteriales bacterium]
MLPLLVLFVVSSAEAQRAPIIQHHAYGPEHGLSNRHVTAVIQDHVGFIWAGTVSGLDRFDGHSFRNWSQMDGLRGGRVSALRRDAKGYIWV